jgi:hypothetical protein
MDETHLRVLDALYHNAGIVASEDMSPPTPEELEEVAALGEFLERLKRSSPADERIRPGGPPSTRG